MADYVPPPTKPPVYRTYAERKEAEEKIRKERNKQTHQEYRLPPIPPPKPAGKHEKYRARPDPVPSADGTPTRDMEPVKIPLKRWIKGEPADVVSLTDRLSKKEDK